MRKQRVQWLVAACLLCLAQPAWAASDSITYQDSLDSISESYPGELQQPSTPERSNIRVVRRDVYKRQLLASLQHKWHHGTLYINKKVPCNDGGLSLGQLWIAHQKNI